MPVEGEMVISVFWDLFGALQKKLPEQYELRRRKYPKAQLTKSVPGLDAWQFDPLGRLATRTLSW